MIGRHTTLLVWALLGVAVVVCQLAAVISRGRLPGAGSLVRMVTTSRGAMVVGADMDVARLARLRPLSRVDLVVGIG